MRLKLASQFTVFLSLIFIFTIALGGLLLSNVIEQKAQSEISDRGQLVMQIVNSVSSYTNDRIAPIINSTVDAQTQFIPEVIPSFAAHRIFDMLKQDWKYRDFDYKSAALNPTNLADKANLFEAKLIERFQSDRTLKTLSGFHEFGGTRLFYSARPTIITNSTCLKCHSRPDVAPKSHVDRYGRENGYDWKLNEVVGTQVVYIPANEVASNARQALLLFISIFTVIFALVLLLINYLLKRRVIQPLKPMAQLAEKLSQTTVNASEIEAFEQKGFAKIARRHDELGQLGRIFQRMVREISLREQQRLEQLKQLRIEIDQAQRKRQVAEIEESDYFQKLQQTAKQIRDQWTSPSQQGH